MSLDKTLKALNQFWHGDVKCEHIIDALARQRYDVLALTGAIADILPLDDFIDIDQYDRRTLVLAKLVGCPERLWLLDAMHVELYGKLATDPLKSQYTIAGYDYPRPSPVWLHADDLRYVKVDRMDMLSLTSAEVKLARRIRRMSQEEFVQAVEDMRGKWDVLYERINYVW